MSPRPVSPLAVTATVAVVTTGLLVAAVAGGWLGADVGRGGDFCEAARGGRVKQPANTLSNLGFVVAGLAVARHAGRAGLGGTATAYACLVVVLGPASAAMHATQSAAGGHLDLLSMYLVASFAAAYALMRLSDRGPRFLAGAFVAFVVGCELVGTISDDVPVVRYSGNVAFAALLLTAIVVEVVLWRGAGAAGGRRTDLRWGAAALATILVAFAIWAVTKSAWCNPDSPVQGHAAWHLLGAVAAYLLHRLWTSEGKESRPGLVQGARPVV